MHYARPSAHSSLRHKCQLLPRCRRDMVVRQPSVSPRIKQVVLTVNSMLYHAALESKSQSLHKPNVPGFRRIYIDLEAMNVELCPEALQDIVRDAQEGTWTLTKFFCRHEPHEAHARPLHDHAPAAKNLLILQHRES